MLRAIHPNLLNLQVGSILVINFVPNLLSKRRNTTQIKGHTAHHTSGEEYGSDASYEINEASETEETDQEDEEGEYSEYDAFWTAQIDDPEQVICVDEDGVF